MDNIPAHFKIKLDPAPNPDAVIQTEHARFTVLTPRMIRMEWSPTGVFEDRASQAFWFRTQPRPEFSVKQTAARLMIETKALRLTYEPDGTFSANNLYVDQLAGSGDQPPFQWRFGDADPGNLLGTARTLDEVDGATPLSLGLVSRSGWSVVDDSNSLVFNEVGWLEPRERPTGQLDLCFLGYGHDYLGCLRDFNLVSGVVPMIPRFVLGNWWSRYWAYTQAELMQLMNDFQAHQVPLSVCIIDMDWHITKTGNQSSGWTGYTWNRELFPDPDGVLRFLHEKGLKVALNLHPAEGVHPHEEMYEEIRQAVGGGIPAGEPVEFDITNPRFVEAYFSILHHRQEARGVDFWWMDWQQGVRTRLSGLDPLWWLNHLHFLDLGRDGKRRSFIFSRWGGLGNHRYPIGFSGDSVVSWASLAFQPYFTSTAANVNYGWWSHDIGGHMGGVEDAELYTRWVQLGTFLPVMRLHSTNNPYHERRPWGWDAETFAAARETMQLRHALIPYLYSMAWRYHRESIPPLLPMYYAYPEKEEAYACPNQYLFGDQLLLAPFITPQDPDTRLSRAVAWLPEGDWFDFFGGQHYTGDSWQAVYGTLHDIPAFAKAGAIVPLGPLAGWDNVETPNQLVVNVFPGADGRFDLYEDEGNSMAYLDGTYAITPMRQAWNGTRTTLTIGPAEGATELLPTLRQASLRFHGFHQPQAVEVQLNGSPLTVEPVFDPQTRTLTIAALQIAPSDRLEISLAGDADLTDRSDSRLATCLRMLKHFRAETWMKATLHAKLLEVLDDPSLLGRYLVQLSDSQARALLETITGAGLDRTSSTGKDLIVLWNNRPDPLVIHRSANAKIHHFWRYKERYPYSNGPLPKFLAYRPGEDFGEGNPWSVQVDYYGMSTVKVEKR